MGHERDWAMSAGTPTSGGGTDGGGAAPALLAVAHGTREPSGVAAVESLAEAVRRRRAGLDVRTAYVEIAAPSVEDALAALAGPVVVLPLLLASGYHDKVDIPRSLRAVRPDGMLGRVLGPDPLLAEALLDRLHAAGWRRRDRVVLGTAGSGDPEALAAAEAQARLLAVRAGVPVLPAYASAAQPTVGTAVAQLRRSGSDRVAVASYLLAPGFFHGRLAAAGADLVTAPLGDHPAVVDLVLARYDEARKAAEQA
jgi:sirohydrochlorin ferrochelatase